MSPEQLSPEQRRALAYRLAFAVTIGLSVEILRGAFLPPLSAVIAIQILAAAPAAPGRMAAILAIVTASAASAAAFGISLLSSNAPLLKALFLSLMYLWAFVVCFLPRLAVLGVMALTMLIVVSSVTNASDAAALLVISEIVTSVVQGFLLVYVSHALFPHRGKIPASKPPDEATHLPPLMRAVFATAVILPAHLFLNADGVASMVVLLTMAAMLRATSLDRSTRYAFGFASGNAIGATIAALSVFVLTQQREAALLLLLILAAAGFFAARIARGDGPSQIFIPGFIAYCMLFGLVYSTAPLGDSVAILGRVAQILAAAIYVVAMASLLLPIGRRIVAGQTVKMSQA